MGLELTYYQRPDDRTTQVPIAEVNPDDEAFFLERGIEISAEDDAIWDGFILYADVGERDESGEPVEIILHTKGRDCRDSLAELARLCGKTGGRDR